MNGKLASVTFTVTIIVPEDGWAKVMDIPRHDVKEDLSSSVRAAYLNGILIGGLTSVVEAGGWVEVK